MSDPLRQGDGGHAPTRLGLLGGTFDPIHFGHLDAAAAAQRSLALDEIRFVPSHDPPHRPSDPRASAFHRFALVALAIEGQPSYRASDIELRRDGPSYTTDTLRAVHDEGWAASQIFFILGADAFAEIATWREFPAVLDAANFVVIARPGTSLETAAARTPALRPRLRQTGAAAIERGGTFVFLVEAHTRDVSSTSIRARLTAGHSIDDLVPAAVARYIVAHKLYGAVSKLHGKDERVQI
ncbi:MAG TPA: nicotinate-nucleotide adenylyltransferase [Vicinamibacterales bacterium]|jgi:nicotinate-nucleotide adenylyltransferase